MSVKIKWKNKYSGEEGYVFRLFDSGDDFVNTTDEREAGVFTASEARSVMEMLQKYQPQNTYAAAELPKKQAAPRKQTAPKKPANRTAKKAAASMPNRDPKKAKG